MEAISFEQFADNRAVVHHDTQGELLPVFQLGFHQTDSPHRSQVEQFIHQRFSHQYQADVRSYLPLLLSATSPSGISAALGFQVAGDTRLFLEQYLDNDIETALSLITDTRAQRQRIVEIGNLASGRQRATQTLFLLLAQLLHDAGYGWVVFTANRAVRIWLARMHLPGFVIREADPQRLADKGASWGSYYDDQPVVLAMNIEHSFSRMNQTTLMGQLRDSYTAQLNQFLTQLP